MASEWQLQRGIAITIEDILQMLIDVHVTGAGPSIWVNDSDLPNLILMFPIHQGGCSRKRLLFVQSNCGRLMWVSPRSNYPKWSSQVNDQESRFHSNNSLGWVASMKLTSYVLQKVLLKDAFSIPNGCPYWIRSLGCQLASFFSKFGLSNPSIWIAFL